MNVTVMAGADKDAPEDPGLVVFRDHCTACHLQTGMGIREMNAPSIAGLPRWYVTDQLRKFRRDQRGFHKDDYSGHLMQANAAALDEKSIAFVGRHIESLAPNQSRNTLPYPNTSAGKRLYQNKCMDCHGEQAEGKRSERIPPMTSQQDWYLLRQMENFQTDKRIHHEKASTSITEEEIREIIAWISQLDSPTK
jgi:cytochrome c oxidase subunit 2